jgi:multiple sugar transport system permease protein
LGRRRGFSAYAFARQQFWRREQLFLTYLGTLMTPPREVTAIPPFLLMKSLGWVNTYQALFLLSAFTASETFLLRQFFLTVARDFEEAARSSRVHSVNLTSQTLDGLTQTHLFISDGG